MWDSFADTRTFVVIKTELPQGTLSERLSNPCFAPHKTGELRFRKLLQFRHNLNRAATVANYADALVRVIKSEIILVAIDRKDDFQGRLTRYPRRRNAPTSHGKNAGLQYRANDSCLDRREH